MCFLDLERRKVVRTSPSGLEMQEKELAAPSIGPDGADAG